MKNFLPDLVLLAIIVHALYHVIATVGVAYGFFHSYKVHKHKWWKLAAGIVWLIISVIAIFFVK